MAEDKTIGGEEWTKEFMEAVRVATVQAVEEHHRAGRPVYFMDDDGDICECTPDKRNPKLSNEEIERILTVDPNR